MNWGDIIVAKLISVESFKVQGRKYCPCRIEKYEHGNGETPETSYKIYLVPLGKNSDKFYRRAYYASDVFNPIETVRQFNTVEEAQMWADYCNGETLIAKMKRREKIKNVTLKILEALFYFGIGFGIGELIKKVLIFK